MIARFFLILALILMFGGMRSGVHQLRAIPVSSRRVPTAHLIHVDAPQQLIETNGGKCGETVMMPASPWSGRART